MPPFAKISDGHLSSSDWTQLCDMSASHKNGEHLNVPKTWAAAKNWILADFRALSLTLTCSHTMYTIKHLMTARVLTLKKLFQLLSNLVMHLQRVYLYAMRERRVQRERLFSSQRLGERCLALLDGAEQRRLLMDAQRTMTQ